MYILIIKGGGGNERSLDLYFWDNESFINLNQEAIMKGMNRVMLIGNIGRDPEIRYTKKGTAVTNLSIATNYTFKDENGVPADHTEWHRVVVWGKQAEICKEYLTKGRLVYTEGRLATRAWNDQQGNPRKTTEIMASAVRFLDSKRKED